MRILIAGDWHSDVHEEPMYRALADLGHIVEAFPWYRYFATSGGGGSPTSLIRRAENKYLFGPDVSRLNRDFVDRCLAVRPDVLFLYRGTHVFPRSLRRLRTLLPGMYVVGGNEDDPFSLNHPAWAWRHFVRGIQYYDLALAHRARDVDEYIARGAHEVRQMRSWFDPHRCFPKALSADEADQFNTDVVFVGHYEADGRLEALEEIVRRGWQLRIFGPPKEWNRVLPGSSVLAGLAPVRFAAGADYNSALNGAKVALCFFSRLNRDTYTRRCFEIPATGTLLLSEYTEDAASLLAPDKEAVFFRSRAEMLSATEGLLSDEARRKAIAAAGLARVWRDGHDVTSRMREVADWIETLRARSSPSS